MGRKREGAQVNRCVDWQKVVQHFPAISFSLSLPQPPTPFVVSFVGPSLFSSFLIVGVRKE